jgi:hypothetical protein
LIIPAGGFVPRAAGATGAAGAGRVGSGSSGRVTEGACGVPPPSQLVRILAAAIAIPASPANTNTVLALFVLLMKALYL